MAKSKEGGSAVEAYSHIRRLVEVKKAEYGKLAVACLDDDSGDLDMRRLASEIVVLSDLERDFRRNGWSE